MNNQVRQNELFASGPVGVWIKILGHKNTKIVKVVGLVLVVVYAGFRVYIAQ